MMMQPYLFFEGRCEEAIAFYREKLGAEVAMVMRYDEMPAAPVPGQPQPPGDKILHATLRLGESVFNLSDGHCRGETKFDGFQLSLIVDTAAKAEEVVAALADGGKITMPMTKTFFSPAFGRVDDKFGVPWQVMVR